jgi:hypothetical protein
VKSATISLVFNRYDPTILAAVLYIKEDISREKKRRRITTGKKSAT